MLRRIGLKWTSRMRSGTIHQTRKHLGRNDGSRCGLGVLCDLAVEEGIIAPPRKYHTNAGPRGCVVYDGSRHNLPAAVVNWAGLKTSYAQYPGEITPGRGCTESGLPSIALDNDSGVSFSELADIIEQHLDAL